MTDETLKRAEEWAKEPLFNQCYNGHPASQIKIFREMQENAIRHGMRLGAETYAIATRKGHPTYLTIGELEIKKAILTAANNFKLP